MTDKDREKAQKDYVSVIDAWGKPDGVLNVVARIRAEERQMAADRAVDWMHQEYPKHDDKLRQDRIDESLRASICNVQKDRP